MSRNALSLASFTALALLASVQSGKTQATAGIPSYFFSEWTIAADCSRDAGAYGQQLPGLRFRISPASLTVDPATAVSSYEVEAIEDAHHQWPDSWGAVKLEYRAGTPLRSVPAEFECIPGQEATSPYLAMSGNSVSAEPYYQQEHWYGTATIYGELHHVLIFPRNVSGSPRAYIVLHDADASDNIQLDHDGTIRTL